MSSRKWAQTEQCLHLCGNMENLIITFSSKVEKRRKGASSSSISIKCQRQNFMCRTAVICCVQRTFYSVAVCLWVMRICSAVLVWLSYATERSQHTAMGSESSALPKSVVCGSRLHQSDSTDSWKSMAVPCSCSLHLCAVFISQWQGVFMCTAHQRTH